MNKYTQKEINEILLTKNLDDFYLAVLENRPHLLTEQEYQDVMDNGIVYGENKEEVQQLFEKNKYKKLLLRVIMSVAQVRYVGILTLIDDDVYNIGNPSFVDLRKNKIIDYENLTNYFDESNARIKIFTPKEEPVITQDAALIDVDDKKILEEYEENHVKQPKSIDLTLDFLKEVRGKYHVKKKTLN